MYFRYNGKDSKQWGYDIKSSLTIEKLDSIEGETLKSTNSYVEKAVRIKKVNKFTGDLVHFSKLEIDMAENEKKLFYQWSNRNRKYIWFH